MNTMVPRVPLTPNAYDEHVLGRVLELATPSAPWYRRLWHSGPLLTAAELLEAGEPRGGAGSRRELQADLLSGLKEDEGLGGRYSQAIRAALPRDAKDLIAGGHSWHALAAARELATPGYLGRWADRVRTRRDVAPEFLARRIGAHLLDHGWSASHLHRWLTYRTRYRTDPVEMPDILEEAESDLAMPPKEFVVCVPLAQAPPLPRPSPPGWMSSRDVAQWRRDHIPGMKPVRQYGGVVFTVVASDAHAAAEEVRARTASLAVRFAVGGRRQLKFGPDMWVSGRPTPFPVEGSPRRVEVHAFERLEKLFTSDVPQQLSSALALIEPLDRGAAPAAITGAWAALEALMLGPADGGKGAAAGRFALVVAASYVRAELTVLAWAHARGATDPLAATINSAPDNRSKALAVEEAIATGVAVTAQRASDEWALGRVKAVQSDLPRGVKAVQSAVQRCLSRLYRQRNLVVHGGMTRAVGSDAALRLAAPLIGAGLDRVAHAMLTGGVSPLELAARARVRLETLRPPTAAGGSGVIDLLE